MCGMARQDGFTLIELIVVILIVGILAAIATPIFLGALDQARVSTPQAALANARLEISLVLVEEGTLPVGAQRTAILTASGDPNIALALSGAGPDYCLSGVHSVIGESWASTRDVVPTRGASCGADGTIALP